MTQKPDWADEVAERLREACYDDENVWFNPYAIADALRKAKADGLREAQKISLDMGKKWENLSTLQPFEGDISPKKVRIAKIATIFIVAALHAQANKIEKGEA
jgi:hypothetical protein